MSSTTNRIELKVKLQPKQQLLLDAVESGIRHPFYGGSKGGGKSFASRSVQLMRRFKYPGTSGLLIRREYKQVYNNHVLKLLQEHSVIMKAGWWNKTDGIVYFPNGSTLTFGHAEHEQDVMIYQGVEYDDIAVEEVTQFTEFMWDVLAGSCRTSKMGYNPVMWATGNPGGVGHTWVKRKWVDRQFTELEDPTDYTFIRARLDDNPALVLADPRYVKSLEAIKDPILRAAYLDGSWDIYPDQFFEGWNRDELEIDPFYIPTSWRLFAGLDHGETKPASFGLYAADHNGHIYRLFGYYSSGVHTANQHAQEIMIRLKNFPYISGNLPVVVYADPSIWTKRRVHEMQVNSPAEEYQRVGLPIRPANNNRVNGWMLCRDSLVTKSFHVFKGHNEDFMRTVPAMPRSKTNPEDVDTHSEDHAGDEWRYVMAHIYTPSAPVVQNVVRPFTGEMALQDLKTLRRKVRLSGYRAV